MASRITRRALQRGAADTRRPNSSAAECGVEILPEPLRLCVYSSGLDERDGRGRRRRGRATKGCDGVGGRRCHRPASDPVATDTRASTVPLRPDAEKTRFRNINAPPGRARRVSTWATPAPHLLTNETRRGAQADKPRRRRGTEQKKKREVALKGEARAPLEVERVARLPVNINVALSSAPLSLRGYSPQSRWRFLRILTNEPAWSSSRVRPVRRVASSSVTAPQLVARRK